MNNDNSNAALARLKQFAWLIDNVGDDRSEWRLEVLWAWAGEMAEFQDEANRTGAPVKYFQRGKVLRILQPETAQQAA